LATEQPSSNDISSNASMTPYVAAVATFLSAMFGNTSVRSDVSSKGGVEFVLDLADSPCLAYDFGDGSASRTLHGVIALLAESKPHLTMTSLLKRAQSAADTLEPFGKHTGSSSFFAPFVGSDRQSTDIDLIAQGTGFAKAFVNIHSLVPTLHACFQASAYHTSRSANSTFNQINVADYYVRLVRSLGPLLGASLKEEMQLQKIVPDYWKNSTRVKDSGFGELVADIILGVELPSPAAEILEPEAIPIELLLNSSNGEMPPPPVPNSSSSPEKKPRVPTKAEQDSPAFKNYQTVRHLLSKMSRSISPFFQTLGKALITKRNPEAFQKQSHIAMAEALAETMLQQLAPSENESSIENFSYWIGMLHVLKDMLIDGKPLIHIYKC
jgi:E3 ubiquitin-protein ligase HUWE1